MDAGTLGRLKVFEGLSEDELEALVDGFEEQEVPAGEVLAREGDFGYHFIGILDGAVGVSRGGQHVAVLEPGDSFGELALIDEDAGRRTATAVATADTRLVSMLSWDFRDLEQRAPAAWERIQKAAAERWP